MSDADFDKEVLRQIWGEYPRDPVSGLVGGVPGRNMDTEWAICDWHHILSRHGGDPMFSSPLNAICLVRICHRADFVNNRYIQAYLLDRAEDAVNEAIREGMYKLTDNDASFLTYRSEWMLKHLRSEA